MKRSFVLITRSYKYGGYCVAGLDTETKKWLRLVSSAALSGNEIPKPVFESFNDLDILEVETAGPAPYGCQSENFLLDMTVPPKKVGKFSFRELLSPAYVSSSPAILGNSFSSLSEEEIVRQRVSLGLYHVSSFFFDYYLGDDGKRHYRSKFQYMGRQYSEISVTDPVYRKDGFAGETIAHALIAVSLPAVPYPNGKYYKFIAKIFPISAEEAEQFETPSPSVSAPHSRVFVRDYPDSSKDDIPRAVQFLRALGEGRDPDTNAALDPARILSPSYAAWLRYCAQTVEKASYNGESRAAEKKVCYLLRENIGKIQLSDDPVSASKLAERVNAVREPYGKAFTSVMVGAFFLAAGFVAEDAAYKRKAPTGIGSEYGVSSEMRVSQKGIRYSLLLYGRAAQQFFSTISTTASKCSTHPLQSLRKRNNRGW